MFASQLNATAASIDLADPVLRASTTTRSTPTANKIADPNEILFNLGNHRLLRVRSDRPDPADDRQPDRQLQDAEDARSDVRDGSRADAELRHQRHVHLPVLPALQLEQPHRREFVRLHAGGHADRQRPAGRIVQRAVLRVQCGRGAAGRRHAATRSTRAITSATWDSRSARSSGCRTTGWRGSGSRPTITASTSSGAESLDDPTPIRTGTGLSINKDGGLVVTQTGGSGKSNIYMVLPKYQFVANGMYQAPWGINLGANWVLRQGYAHALLPQPGGHRRSAVELARACSSSTTSATSGCRRSARSTRASRRRSRFQRVNIALDLDVFNVFNNVDGPRQSSTTFASPRRTTVLEIMNPRILRLGARLTSEPA